MAPGSPAATVLAALDARAPFPRTPVVCLDGPSGSGKSTLARQLAAARPGTAVVQTDRLLDGWGGLGTLPEVLVRQVLAPLRDGRPVQHRDYDWNAGHFTTPVVVPACDLLVLEGVGSAARPVRALADLTVWLDAPPEERRRRAEERDPTTEAWWEPWRRAEAAHHVDHGTREAADLVLST